MDWLQSSPYGEFCESATCTLAMAFVLVEALSPEPSSPLSGISSIGCSSIRPDDVELDSSEAVGSGRFADVNGIGTFHRWRTLSWPSGGFGEAGDVIDDGSTKSGLIDETVSIEKYDSSATDLLPCCEWLLPGSISGDMSRLVGVSAVIQGLI